MGFRFSPVPRPTRDADSPLLRLVASLVPLVGSPSPSLSSRLRLPSGQLRSNATAFPCKVGFASSAAPAHTLAPVRVFVCAVVGSSSAFSATGAFPWPSNPAVRLRQALGWSEHDAVKSLREGRRRASRHPGAHVRPAPPRPRAATCQTLAQLVATPSRPTTGLAVPYWAAPSAGVRNRPTPAPTVPRTCPSGPHRARMPTRRARAR